jgi:deoxyribonuclease IV
VPANHSRGAGAVRGLPAAPREHRRHRLVGIERVGSLHLNDSTTPLGSQRDRHANVGEGEIGADRCAVFLSEPRFDGLPCVLETPGPNHSGPSAQELALARALRERGLAARRRHARAPAARR